MADGTTAPTGLGGVFVVGAPRSGTTALAHALANHSDFWTSEETHILYWLYGDGRFVQEFERWRTDRASATWLRAQDVSAEEFLSYVGLGLNALFKQRSWGKRWIDHTPYYVLMIDALASMFPDATFIHILRDGRSVVNSMINVGATLSADEQSQMQAGEFLPPWSTDFRAACKAWRESVEAGAGARERHPRRLLEVRHDELSNDPESGFRAIYGFLAAEYESRPVDYWHSNRVNSSFAGVKKTRSRLSESEGAWTSWSKEQRQVFIEEVGDTMMSCGFTVEPLSSSR